MAMLAAKDKIFHLSQLLNKYSKQYYRDGKSPVSDFKYDQLYKELQDLEAEHPDLILVDSPTKKVGHLPKIKPTTQLCQHHPPMLSLQNSYSVEDVNDWIKRCEKGVTGPLEYVVEGKYDGIAASARYNNGELEYVATRGDGNIGEIIPKHIAPLISCLPQRLSSQEILNIDTSKNSLDIRGELVIPWQAWKDANAIRSAADQPLFKTPRNLASGLLRLVENASSKSKRPSALASMKPSSINFLSYSLLSNDFRGKGLSQWEQHFQLEKLNLKPSPIRYFAKSQNEVLEVLKDWESRRNFCEFPLDGMVIKVNDAGQQSHLGNSTKIPKWAIAYKFPAQAATTKVHSISLQVGRSGKVTPVAELDPVILAGVTVSRATLNNFSFIEKFKLKPGDEVQVERSGDVIPKIVSVSSSKTGKEFLETLPRLSTGELQCPCPIKSPLHRGSGETYHCSHGNCPNMKINSIIHFCSKPALQITGMGESTIQELLELGIISDFSSIFQLESFKLKELEGWGDTRIENILKSIENSKKTPYSRILFGLGIPGIGKQTAEIIAKQIGGIEHLMSASQDDLMKVDGIGSGSAKGIVDFFGKKENVDMCRQLVQLGLNLNPDSTDTTADSTSNLKIKIEDSMFYRKNMVVSGTFQKMSREDIKQEILNFGGNITSTVNKKTDFLLAGDEVGPSKLKKAEELGNVRVMSEDEFVEYVTDHKK